MSQKTPREVAEQWFNGVKSGNTEMVMDSLSDDVEWINMQPVEGVSDILPWTGTYQGKEGFGKAFGVYLSVVDVKLNEPQVLIAEGDQAAVKIHEIGTCKETGRDFEINFVIWMEIARGKIIRFKSYTDPSPILAAFKNP